MTMLSISCPSCGFSREMPADRVPEGERKVTCPQCHSVFTFSKGAPIPEPVATSQPVSPPEQAPPPASPRPVQPEPAPPELQPASPEPQPASPDSPPPAGAAIGAAPGASAAPRKPRPPRPAPPPELTDVAGLFKESWELFQRRFSTLIGLFLLTLVAFVLPVAAAVGLGMAAGMALEGGASALIGLVGFAASAYLGFRCSAGFLHAVADEGLALKDALSRGNGTALPLMWVCFLTGFIIMGGYLFLIIPGIIFTVWFCIAQFVLVREDLRGMDALLKSREYVRGQWFNVALRLLLVWAASLLLGAIPLAGPLLSIIFIPYLMIFHYLVYRDLREMKGDVPFSCGVADKLKWPGVALLGMVVLPAALISLIGVSLLGPLAQLASREGITVVQGGAPGLSAVPGDQGLRVITFPQGGPQAGAVPGESADAISPASPGAPGGQQPSGQGANEPPEDVHIFIYATNYTGTIRVNGTTLREMEGKPDMQYNYNLDGRSLRYGQNLIEVVYAEVPSHHEGLLGVKIKISRSRTGGERELLGEWKVEEKGNGSSSFTLDLAR